MKRRDVKKHLLEHSSAKVRLLGEYLKRYLNIICNDGFTEQINVYDVFCGEGLYDDGGEGSPLVILRAVRDIHFVNVAKLRSVPKIHCHFNDLEALKVEKLEKVIAERNLHYPEFGDLVFSTHDYAQEIVRLRELLSVRRRGEKNFVFVDPYQYKHIRISQIRDLLASGQSEVLLWLPTQFMYRFAKNGTPEALFDFIDELDLKWDGENVWDFINDLKDGFKAALGSFFVDTFTIQKDSATVFCLFFFTPHVRGFEKMLEAKWEMDAEHGQGWSYDIQPNLFAEQKPNPLEAKLKIFLKDNERSNSEVYLYTLQNGFLPKHTNEIFYNWQNRGLLEVLLSDRKKARKRAFYINYRNHKEEPNRVTIKLK